MGGELPNKLTPWLLKDIRPSITSAKRVKCARFKRRDCFNAIIKDEWVVMTKKFRDVIGV